MISNKVSIVVPFYNPPVEAFKKCLESIKALNPYEVILVDDCSSHSEIIEIARKSHFVYLKTPYQSGHDGVPFNLGVHHSSGEYICKVDSDDLLLELPSSIPHKIHLARMNRSVDPTNITLEELILAPRSIFNGALVEKELMLQTLFENDASVFSDVLTVLRFLYRKISFSVHPKINYIYNHVGNSLQTKKSIYYHRLSNIQTIARLCQLENIPPEQCEYFLKLAMLNLRYGANARKFLHHSIHIKKD